MTALYIVLGIFLVIVIASRILRPVEAETVTGPEDLAALARGGKKIAAIKAYRQMNGVSLREAKEAVDRMAAGEAPPASPARDSLFAGMNAATNALQTGGRQDGPDLAAVRELIRAGNMIHAIKVYRQSTGCGLREAKDAVERIAREL